MKEKIYLLLVVIASSFLAGCSSDSETFSIKGESLSETPILLQSDSRFFSVNTRASIDTIQDIDTLGVFCVAREKTGIHGSDEASDVNWMQILENTHENYGFTTNGIYWNNVKFRPGETTDGRTKLEALEGEDFVGFYPVTNWYGYDFYAYYPYKDGYIQASDSLAVDFTIDGTNDIIWGRSNKVADPYAYSARYIKSMNNKNVPMTLKHCTTQFRFFLLPAADGSGKVVQPEKVKNLSIKEIKLLDVHSNIRMTLAKLNSDESAGAVYPIGVETTDFILKDKVGSAISDSPIPVPYNTVIRRDTINDINILADSISDDIISGDSISGDSISGDSIKIEEYEEIMTDTVRIGDCIMVYPGCSEYYMSMCMCDTDNPENEYRSEKRISIKTSDSSVFKPGYIYNIYITVNGVTFVSMDATLQEWTNAADDPSLKFEIY